MRTIMPERPAGEHPTPAETFTALFTEHATRVRRVILARLRPGDTANVEDLTQEVFLGLWRHLASGHQVTRPAGLLATMARRRVVDHYRLCRNTRETATDTGAWQFANRNLAPSTAGTYAAVATGFRTAKVGGAR